MTRTHTNLFILIAIIALMLPFTAQANSYDTTNLKASINDYMKGHFAFRSITGWGHVKTPASEEPKDKDNLILRGGVRQPIQLYRFNEDLTFNTAVGIEYVKDSEKFDYNNEIKLGTGFNLRYRVTPRFTIEIGLEYEWNRQFYPTSDTLEGLSAYSGWYAGWSMDRFFPKTIKKYNFSFPGDTWGNVRFPTSFSRSSEDNAVLQGAFEQGLDWFKFRDMALNTYGQVFYNFDSQGFDYNNFLTFSIGTKLKIKSTERLNTNIGIQYNENFRLVDGLENDTVSVYLSWYF